MKVYSYKSVLIIERIKTSLILPKIILGATIILFAFSIAMAYVIFSMAFATGNLDVIISSSAQISDSIKAMVNPGE